MAFFLMAKVILTRLPLYIGMLWSTMVNTLNYNQFQKIPAEVYTEIIEVRE